MGFKKDLNNILDTLPRSRQTLLFSATQSTSISQLARLSLNVTIFWFFFFLRADVLQEPEYISVHVNSQFSTPVNLSQSYMICPENAKANFLWSFLRSHVMQKTMVFMATQKQVRFQFKFFSLSFISGPILLRNFPTIKTRSFINAFTWKNDTKKAIGNFLEIS